MKKAISAETLFEDFVEQIDTAVDAVATQFPYTRQKIPLYTNSRGILPVIQEQVHWVRERTMSRKSVILMEYVRGITGL